MTSLLTFARLSQWFTTCMQIATCRASKGSCVVSSKYVRLSLGCALC